MAPNDATLLGLPREILLQILRYVLPQDFRITIHYEKINRLKVQLVSRRWYRELESLGTTLLQPKQYNSSDILTVCYEMLNCGSEVLWSGNTIQFNDAESTQNFVRLMPPLIKANITRLAVKLMFQYDREVEHSGRCRTGFGLPCIGLAPGRSSSLDALKHFPRLRKLEIEIVGRTLEYDSGPVNHCALHLRDAAVEGLPVETLNRLVELRAVLNRMTHSRQSPGSAKLDMNVFDCLDYAKDLRSGLYDTLPAVLEQEPSWRSGDVSKARQWLEARAAKYWDDDLCLANAIHSRRCYQLSTWAREWDRVIRSRGETTNRPRPYKEIAETTESGEMRLKDVAPP